MSLLSVKTQNTIVILVSHTNLVTKPYFSSGASRALIHSAVRPLRNGSAPTHAAPSRAPDARRGRGPGAEFKPILYTPSYRYTRKRKHAGQAASYYFIPAACTDTRAARTVRQTLHFTQIYVFIYPPSPLLPPSPHARLTSGSGGNHGVAVAVRASQLTLQLTWQKDGSIALGTLSALP